MAHGWHRGSAMRGSPAVISGPIVLIWKNRQVWRDTPSLPAGLRLSPGPLSPDQHPTPISCLIREGNWALMDRWGGWGCTGLSRGELGQAWVEWGFLLPLLFWKCLSTIPALTKLPQALSPSVCTTLTWHPCPSTVFLALPYPSSALHGSLCFVSAGEGEREGGNWYCASGSGLPTQKGCLKQETSLSHLA